MVKSNTSSGGFENFQWCVWGWRLYLWVILFLPIRWGLTGKLGCRKDTVLGVLHRARGCGLTEFFVGLLAITKQMYIKKRE